MVSSLCVALKNFHCKDFISHERVKNKLQSEQQMNFHRWLLFCLMMLCRLLVLHCDEREMTRCER
jgi:hypothetical protein